MNSQEAFAALLKQVEVALEESLVRHRAAATAGDFEAIEIEVDRQKNLVGVRNQLQTLKELWPGLVGELLQQSAEESRPTVRPHPTEGRPSSLQSKGRPIFARYKDHRYEAVFLPDHHILLDGEEYSSPSSAASAVAGGTSVNGWRFWRYVDEKGREQLIDVLR